jgi:N6-L-threonylcarbamoyladenine synthase
VLSNVVATQIPFHEKYNGVVPEIASRMHTEWIYDVAREALDKAGLSAAGIDGVAAAAHPGLLGSLLVGLSFAKACAWALDKPLIAVDHMLAHLYAGRLASSESAEAMAYPFLGLLVSGGHTLICRVEGFDEVQVLGGTIDDAVGEAFDKVAKFYRLGYPGGLVIDNLAKEGDPDAFRFPLPHLYKGEHPYDVSYSGLKTAVINQLDQFRRLPKQAAEEQELRNIAASFQKTAVEILLRSLLRAASDTGLSTVVAGGGVAANSLLRARLAECPGLRCVFPPLELCGDNGAMIAGVAYHYLMRGDPSPLSTPASSRVQAFKRRYP